MRQKGWARSAGLLAALALAAAQPPTVPSDACINTLAGTVLATQCGGQISDMPGLATALSTVYYTSSSQVLGVTAPGACAVVAGTLTGGTYVADGVAAVAANLQPTFLAADPAGDLFISDSGGNRVFKVRAADGIIVTVAGTGDPHTPNTGDGGPATSASVAMPQQVALDHVRGALAIVAACSIRRVDFASGIINTVAGQAGQCSSNGPGTGDGGPATAAILGEDIAGLAYDPATGALFIAFQVTVRRVDPATGIITTWAGTGSGGNNGGGNGGPATAATFFTIGGIAISPSAGSGAGAMFVADGDNGVRIIDLNTTIITGYLEGMACAGNVSVPGCAGPAVGVAVSLDGVGPLQVTTSLNFILSFPSQHAIPVVMAGSEPQATGDGNAASAATFAAPAGLATAPDGTIYIADGNQIRRFHPAVGIMETFAGNGFLTSCGDGGPATAACVHPRGIAVQPGTGDVFMTDDVDGVVRRISASTGIITTVAGHPFGSGRECGDGGPATAACLAEPFAIAFAPPAISSDYYILDQMASLVRVVHGDTGIIDTFAGGGPGTPPTRGKSPLLQRTMCPGCGGDGGPATSACFCWPSSLAVDPSTGDVFVGEQFSCRVRRIFIANGTIATIAGGNATGTCSATGDGLPATVADVGLVSALMVHPADGSLYLAETAVRPGVASSGGVIRRISPTTGIISRIAGNPLATSVYCGDGGAATSGCFSTLTGIAADPIYGNIYGIDMAAMLLRGVALPPDTSSASGVNPAPIGGWKTLCPPGYACPCMRPAPCTNPGQVCPVNSVAPFNTTAGYVAVAMASTAADAAAGQPLVYSAQLLCPPGGFCSGGVHTPCPAGSYSASPRQFSVTSCSACPSGYFNGDFGATSVQQCLACPPGTGPSNVSRTFLAGAASCSWCPPGTTSIGGGTQCVPCTPGTAAVFGSTACSRIAPGASLVVSDTVAVLELPPVASVELDAPAPPIAAVEAPFFVFFAIPLVIFLGALCCNQYPVASQLVHALRVLRRVDQYGLSRTPDEGQSVVMHKTALGGAVSLVALGTILALAASLITRYATSNTLVQRAMLPAQVDDLSDALSWSFATRTSTDGAGITSGDVQGLQVRLSAQGASCGPSNVSFEANGLQAGAFVYAPGGSLPSSGLFAHAFVCAACTYGRLSRLVVTLPPACQTMAVTVVAVSSRSAVTALSYDIGPTAAGTFLHAATLAVTPTIDLFSDAVNSYTARGILLHDATGAGVDLALAASPPTAPVTVTLYLAADTTFVTTTIQPVMTPAQLLSSIIGLSGLVGAFAIVFSFLEGRMANRQARFEGEGSPGADDARYSGTDEEGSTSSRRASRVTSGGSEQLVAKAATGLFYVPRKTGDGAAPATTPAAAPAPPAFTIRRVPGPFDGVTIPAKPPLTVSNPLATAAAPTTLNP